MIPSDCKIPVNYFGPETSRWAGLLIKICRENMFLQFYQNTSHINAQINLLGGSSAAVVFIHETRKREVENLGVSPLLVRPHIFLSESDRMSESAPGEIWLDSTASAGQIETAIVHAILRGRLDGSGDVYEAREIVARTVHDLKGPIAAIIAYCQVALESEPDSERNQQFFSRIDANARMADNLIVRHLTDFRAIKGKISSAPTLTNLREWLSDDLAFEIETITKKGLQFELSVNAAVPIEITIDQFLLSQVIKNLLENAAKHTKTGKISVEVSFQPKDSRLRIDVVDSGVGIAFEKREEIFQIFSEEITEHKLRDIHSIGIGLNNARRLTQVMGGNVFLLDSKPGRGSTFRVEVEA